MAEGREKRDESGSVLSDMTAKDVIRRLAAGDEKALRLLFDRYAGLVNGLALRILRNDADAEDVVQAVFLQAWRQADRYDAGRGTPAAWLCTMARTRALDLLRRRVSRKEEPCDIASGSMSAPGFVERLAVQQALAGLSTNQRQALELAYYEGLTQAEISERLATPLGTVKTRIRTALIRLREMFGSSDAAVSHGGREYHHRSDVYDQA
jgi:RNA polymerase sigma-70 factor (ECF subfamily)